MTYLIDSSGTNVASYSYDPYGQIQQATGSMAQINPLRYRGYYYDSDTEFYYLQSRYYDAAICRFINADKYTSTDQSIIGYNMFAYCLNNPVINVDASGMFSWGKLAAICTVAVAVVVGVAASVATCGAASVATTMAISTAVTVAAKTAEVATLQAKKSKNDGDSTTEMLDDVVNAVFDNGAKIIGLLAQRQLQRLEVLHQDFISNRNPFKIHLS